MSNEMDSCDDTPDLSFLPDDYEYKLISYEEKEGINFKASFRIKNLTTKEQSKEWLKLYQEKSKLTWRVARTFNTAGKYVIHRTDYRCQHKTDHRHRIKQEKKNKNTDCPATVKIVIERYFDAPKFKNVDDETKEYPCVVELFNCHNHSLNSAFALRHRDMSTTTREKLLHYYHTGHSASSALHALKAELMFEKPENYTMISLDNSILPTLSVVQHLFDNTLSKMYGTKQKRNLEELENFLGNNFVDNKDIIKDEIMAWASELCQKIEENDTVFVPAAEKFIANHKQTCGTDASFVSALYTYGSSSCCKKFCNLKKTGKSAQVKPKSVGCEKKSLSATKRKSSVEPKAVVLEGEFICFDNIDSNSCI